FALVPDRTADGIWHQWSDLAIVQAAGVSLAGSQRDRIARGLRRLLARLLCLGGLFLPSREGLLEARFGLDRIELAVLFVLLGEEAGQFGELSLLAGPHPRLDRRAADGRHNQSDRLAK